MSTDKHGLNKEKLSPLAPSLSSLGGEGVSAGRVRGFYFLFCANLCVFEAEPEFKFTWTVF